MQLKEKVFEIVYIKSGQRKKINMFASSEKQARILCYLESGADDIISVADVTDDV